MGKRRAIVLVILSLALIHPACSGRRVDSEGLPEESKDKKIENLSSALSRAQSRIEELDAKVSALSDKVDASRLALDNLAGTHPLKVETVGSARGAEEASEPKPLTKDGKVLLRMDAATTDFIKAMNLFKNGKYGDSELEFNRFTEKYPEHVLAGSAQFYSGESYYMMGEYKLAINEYSKVLSSFSSSPRVPSAMARLAHCYQQTGNDAEEKRTLAQAHELYEGNPSLDWPGPIAAKKSAAGAELKTAPMEPAAKAAGETKPPVEAPEEKEQD